MKKRILSILLTALMLISALTITGTAVSAEDENPAFADVPESKWFARAVNFCAENGYMSGTGHGLFCPGATLTRAMVVTMLWRMAGSPAPERDYHTDYPFVDVDPEAWYALPVYWAYKNSITVGVSMEKFNPKAAISREQFAIMLFQFCLKYMCEVDVTARGSLEQFTDVTGNNNALSWAIASGIMSGRTSSTLAPKEKITRAEAAQMIYKLGLLAAPSYYGNDALLEEYGLTVTPTAYANRMPVLVNPGQPFPDNRHTVSLKIEAAEGRSVPEMRILGSVSTLSGTANRIEFEMSKSDDGAVYFHTGEGALNSVTFEDNEPVRIDLTIFMEGKTVRLSLVAIALVAW